MKTFFDVESAPLELEKLLPIMPEFEPPANLRDPEKIKTALEAKRQSWLDDCALKATTGRIIAASSCRDNNEPEFYCSPDERTMLDILFAELCQTISQGGRIYAWNLFGFDLPFLAQRCAIHGIPAFKTFTTSYRGRWSWNECFVDAMQVWCGPGQRSDGASLKAVAFALGVGSKSGSGKDFAALLRDDPVAAKNYSIQDTQLLRSIVSAMQI